MIWEAFHARVFWVVLARFLWRNGSGSFCRTCCTRRCCEGSPCCSAGSAACSAGGSSWACGMRPSAYRWVLVLDSSANYHPQILQTEPVSKIRPPVQGRSLQSGLTPPAVVSWEWERAGEVAWRQVLVPFSHNTHYKESPAVFAEILA